MTRGLGAGDELARTMAPKSATTAVSLLLSEGIGGMARLTAVPSVARGVFGAVVGPALLTLLRIRGPRARGLAIGVSSHGIGTSQMLQVGDMAGAFSGCEMAVSALATTALLPLLLLALG
ncbi:LrgB family protein [Streptomyces luteogriseus]|uniref:LrgB family protein n=1 Tax=Streptomyces luteogriseus TaxID=68233 RepID=UPI003812B030